MTNTKTTKRALIASVISLLLCVTMFVGSTLAWFTDTASIGVNRIQAGTLDIELLRGIYSSDNYMDAPDDYQTLSDESLIPEDILWEPGYLWYDNLIVRNNGSLNAKYKVNLVATSEIGELADVIDVYVSNTRAFVDTYGTDKNVRDYINGEYAGGTGSPWDVFDYLNPPTKLGTLAEVINGQVSLFGDAIGLVPNGGENLIAIALKMQETAGNEYQGKSAGSFDIVVTATQDTAESDSYNDQYDKDASIVIAGSQSDLNDAIVNATTPIEVVLPKGEYTLPTKDMQNKDLTFTGGLDTVVDLSDVALGHTQAALGAAVSFDGVTVKFDNTEDYTGLAHTEKVFYKDCTIIGKQTLYSDAEFVNCTFVNKDDYAVWTWGAKNVTFTNCTFQSGGKALLVYCDTNTENFTVNVMVDGCAFYDDDTLNTVKAAVETGANPKSTTTVYNITIKDTTIEGFALNNEGTPTGTCAYGNKNSMGADYLKVTMTNVTEGDLIIATADDMFAFAAAVNGGDSMVGKTVILLNDIDLDNKAWTPVGQTGATQFGGTFDGNGYTIKNLNVDSSAETGGNYSSGLFGWIERKGSDANYLMAVKNLTVKGATVTGNHNVAVIAGYLIGTIDNCHVEDATVVCTHANNDACGDKAGTIAGIAAETNAVIKNCTAKNSTVTAGRDAGQIVGACLVGKVENCSADNVTVSVKGDCTGANINNALIGRTK